MATQRRTVSRERFLEEQMWKVLLLEEQFWEGSVLAIRELYFGDGVWRLAFLMRIFIRCLLQR